VIASQVGGLAYLVQDGVTGYHVPDGDDEVLCGKLTALLGDTSLRQQLGRNAAGYAQSYAWENIAGQIMGVYNDVIDSTIRAQSLQHQVL
jgi:D-inositol-3-phosphate glycosyltransferase